MQKSDILNNQRDDGGNKYSDEYLKEGAVYAIDNYPGSPADKNKLYGDGIGTNKFSLGPINQKIGY